MPDGLRALCFLAGANSIFIANVLLTNHQESAAGRDADPLGRLGISSGLGQGRVA
jgi:biotin synthase